MNIEKIFKRKTKEQKALIRKTVIDIIIKLTDENEEKFSDDLNLGELYLDSLDKMELFFELEKEFQIDELEKEFQLDKDKAFSGELNITLGELVETIFDKKMKKSDENSNDANKKIDDTLKISNSKKLDNISLNKKTKTL